MERWRRRLTAVALLGPGLLLAACEDPGELDLDPSEVDPLNPPEAAPAMEAPGAPNVILASPFRAAPAAQGPIDGHLQVTAPPVGDPPGVRVNAHVEGLSPGPHAWHVHSGPCGVEAPVVVAFTPTAEMPGIGEPLVAGPEGVADETAFVPEAMLSREQIEAGAYSVHVHRQGGVDHGPTVACAEL